MEISNLGHFLFEGISLVLFLLSKLPPLELGRLGFRVVFMWVFTFLRGCRPTYFWEIDVFWEGFERRGTLSLF